MEAILREIATRREPTNALEPGKFVLKPEVFQAEYDGTFFHQTLQASKGILGKLPLVDDISRTDGRSSCQTWCD